MSDESQAEIGSAHYSSLITCCHCRAIGLPSLIRPISFIAAMRFAVLASQDSWYLRDLVRAAAGRHELLPVAFCDLTSMLSSDGASVASGDVPLEAMNAVIVRTMPPGS